MDSSQTSQQPRTLSRREAMRHMAIIASGLSFGLSTACTPLKIGLGMHPRMFDTDLELRDRVLRAFVTTVIPGAPADDPGLYVSDGAAVPGSLAVNTSLTILANAERIAAGLVDRYSV